MYNESITELNKRLKSVTKEHSKAQKRVTELQKEMDLIADLIKAKKEHKASKLKGIHKTDIPASWDKDMFYEQKVIYAINESGGEASVNAVTDYIGKLEKRNDLDALYRRIQQVIIKLTKEYKVIKFGKYGSSYKLNIIDE